MRIQPMYAVYCANGFSFGSSKLTDPNLKRIETQKKPSGAKQTLVAKENQERENEKLNVMIGNDRIQL